MVDKRAAAIDAKTAVDDFVARHLGKLPKHCGASRPNSVSTA